MSEKKKATIFNAVLLIIVFILTVIGSTIEYEGIEVGAKECSENPYGETFKIRCTLYTDKGLTASGQETREGVIAGKREWLGKSANIYSINEDGSIGELIGIYEFLDTGYGINGSLINGTSVDVWVPDDEAVREWQRTFGDFIFIQIYDSYG